MLNFFSIRSFKLKLLIIIWISSTATLLLAGGGFVFFEVGQFDKDLARELKVIAAMIADKSTSAIMFNDPAIAEDALFAAAAIDPTILAATIYNIKGDVVASYTRAPRIQAMPPPVSQTNTSFIKGGRLHLFSTVNMYSDHIGTVYIMASRDLLYQRLRRSGIIVAAIMTASLLFLLIISFVLQKMVSAPVMALIASAKKATKEKDYSVRTQSHSNDEIGILTETFNNMLAKIQERERELLESQEFIAEISANIPGLVFQFYTRQDGEMGLNYVSERSEEIFGLPPRCEGYFERFSEWVAPESKDEFLASITRAVKTKTPWSYVGEFIRPDGVKIWIEGVAHPRIKGEQLVFDGIILNITGQKESERNYREIFNAAGAAIFLHDAADGSILDVNQATIDMFGYTYEEISRLSVGDLSSSKSILSKEKAQALLNKAVTDKPQVFDWHGRRKNGELFWLEVSLHASKIGGENRVLAVCQDITARKRSEDQSRAERAFSDGLINSLPGVFFVYDEKQCLIRWNKNHETATGYTAKELSGMHAMEWFSTEDQPRVAAAIAEIFATGSFELEAELIIKDGSKRPYIFSGAPFSIDAKNFFVGVGMDLTERHKLEAELRQAQKMEAIGTLAGGIAHDFNNILSAIFGYTELARMRCHDNPELLEDLDEVYKGADRAKNLVKQILTFSRRSEQEKRPLQISLIVKESLQLLRSSLPASIEIKQNIASQATVLADPTQIHQVIMNLCTNAYHAMRDGGGILGVGLEKITISADDTVPGLDISPGPYLRLEISDTGIGINQQTCEQIFEPYFTTKEAGDGTGLGLAVVHGIIESHHGYINVYSEPGQGTVFNVYLPATKDEARKPATATGSKSLPRGDERIMFVDDEEQITSMAQATLPRYGYRLDTFANGESAWQEYKNNPDQYDLVITDMTMPKMSGAELSQKILKLRPAQPIFLCTGFSETIDREKAKAIGISKYIPKPLIMSKLIQSIKHILHGTNHA